MTPQDHNKMIGIMHLIYGGFNALIMLIFIPLVIAAMAAGASGSEGGGGIAAVFGIFGAFMLLIALLFGLPPILAGYAMLKRKRWAKTAGVIAACVESISMPFGTALCVYTLWFLFGPGQNLHSGGNAFAPQDWRGSLREGSAYDWETRRPSQSGRPREYVPPPQPPDWRG
ncbi:MAG TPA: hypothetical protein VF586_01915 [Pyrinomonadaceae bacterium]|jgi:hypothetical protein